MANPRCSNRVNRTAIMTFMGAVITSLMLSNGHVVEVELNIMHDEPLIECAGYAMSGYRRNGYLDLICKEMSGELVRKIIKGVYQI